MKDKNRAEANENNRQIREEFQQETVNTWYIPQLLEATAEEVKRVDETDAPNEPVRKLYDLVTSPEDALHVLEKDLLPFMEDTLDVMQLVFGEMYAFVAFWSMNYKGKCNTIENKKFECLAWHCYAHVKQYMLKWTTHPMWHQAPLAFAAIWAPKSEDTNSMAWNSALYLVQPNFTPVMRLQDNLYVWRRIKHLMTTCWRMKHSYVYSWQEWSGYVMLADFFAYTWIPYCIEHINKTIDTLKKDYSANKANNSENKPENA